MTDLAYPEGAYLRVRYETDARTRATQGVVVASATDAVTLRTTTGRRTISRADAVTISRLHLVCDRAAAGQPTRHEPALGRAHDSRCGQADGGTLVPEGHPALDRAATCEREKCAEAVVPDADADADDRELRADGGRQEIAIDLSDGTLLKLGGEWHHSTAFDGERHETACGIVDANPPWHVHSSYDDVRLFAEDLCDECFPERTGGGRGACADGGYRYLAATDLLAEAETVARHPRAVQLIREARQLERSATDGLATDGGAATADTDGPLPRRDPSNVVQARVVCDQSACDLYHVARYDGHYQPLCEDREPEAVRVYDATIASLVTMTACPDCVDVLDRLRERYAGGGRR